MSFQGDYSKLYDTFNSEKDYAAESNFICTVFNNFSSIQEPLSILDLGCGSGKHLFELEKLFTNEVKLTGVEKSIDLCKKAKQLLGTKAEIYSCDINEFVSADKFDLIVSLFHVSAYQTTAAEFLNFIEIVSHNLSDQGVAIIDFWNRTAWFDDPPVIRSKSAQFENMTYERISVPEIDLLNGTLILTMDIERVTENSREKVVTEFHALRALTLFEIELAASANGLSANHFGAWMKLESSLTIDTWYGYTVLSKPKRGI
jgi:SAM-dependent methyltransferase